MSDVAPVADAPGAPAPEAPAAPPEVNYDSDGPPEGFTPERMWKEIKDRRKGEQTARADHKPYKDVFDGLDETDRSAIFEFVKAYKADPAQAGSIASQWAQALTPAERGDIAEATGAAATDAPLTLAQFNQLMEQREATRKQEEGTSRAVEDMQREAKALGYEIDSSRYDLLLSCMLRTGTTDVKVADEHVKAMFQADRDAYVESKAREAENGKTVTNAGGPAAGKREIKSLADADAAAREYLKSL